jgi:general secretion pathway protein J
VDGGFTLVELLVSLTIFGMLSAAGVALLSFSVQAQEAASVELEKLGEVRRFGSIMTSDFAQAAPRISREPDGSFRPAFVGGTGQGETTTVSLVRRGWENLDGANRSSLQKVEYRLRGQALERVAYRFVDGAPPMEPVVLAEGVRSLRLRYRDKEGAWRERWDPVEISELPRAVELILDTEQAGTVRQLFLVGSGT